MSTRDDDGDDYEVGYGRPPKGSQFKKGQSGNPRGRPPGAKGFKACVKREMQAKITVSEGKSRMSVTKTEALAKRVVAMALGGDIKAITKLLEIDDQVFGDDSAAAGGAAQGLADAVDYEILAHYFGDHPAASASTGDPDPEEEQE